MDLNNSFCKNMLCFLLVDFKLPVLTYCTLQEHRQILHPDTEHLVEAAQTLHLYSLSDSVLSKTAIFPKKEGRKREISNESVLGSSLRQAHA